MEFDDTSDEESNSSKTIPGSKRRMPKCVSCKLHGVEQPARGHRGNCPYTECRCSCCSAHRFRLRRRMLAKKTRSTPGLVQVHHASVSRNVSPDSSVREPSLRASSLRAPPATRPSRLMFATVTSAASRALPTVCFDAQLVMGKMKEESGARACASGMMLRPLMPSQSTGGGVQWPRFTIEADSEVAASQVCGDQTDHSLRPPSISHNQVDTRHHLYNWLTEQMGSDWRTPYFSRCTSPLTSVTPVTPAQVSTPGYSALSSWAVTPFRPVSSVLPLGLDLAAQSSDVTANTRSPQIDEQQDDSKLNVCQWNDAAPQLSSVDAQLSLGASDEYVGSEDHVDVGRSELPSFESLSSNSTTAANLLRMNSGTISTGCGQEEWPWHVPHQSGYRHQHQETMVSGVDDATAVWSTHSPADGAHTPLLPNGFRPELCQSSWLNPAGTPLAYPVDADSAWWSSAPCLPDWSPMAAHNRFDATALDREWFQWQRPLVGAGGNTDAHSVFSQSAGGCDEVCEVRGVDEEGRDLQSTGPQGVDARQQQGEIPAMEYDGVGVSLPHRGTPLRDYDGTGLTLPQRGTTPREYADVGAPLPHRGTPLREYGGVCVPLPHRGTPMREYEGTSLTSSYRGTPLREYADVGAPLPHRGTPLKDYDGTGLTLPNKETPLREYGGLGLPLPHRGTPLREYDGTSLAMPHRVTPVGEQSAGDPPPDFVGANTDDVSCTEIEPSQQLSSLVMQKSTNSSIKISPQIEEIVRKTATEVMTSFKLLSRF